MTLSNFDKDDFLKNYWQKKPLLIRNALPDFHSPLSPDELAGLACEEDIESRLIVGADQQWQLTHGPLEDHHFEALPEREWTLLVQAVDHWMPEVASLIDNFNFIPYWRIDDIMVSYAADGGSVGPHYDNYDVFLVQGLGQRRWQLGQYCHDSEAHIPHEQLKILQHFDSQQEWLLNPGDILYVPPRYAHWGVGAGEDCMTYSVGFRAPSHSEILSHFCDFQLAQLNQQQRFQDPAIASNQPPGEINAASIEYIQAVLQQQLNNPAAIAQWFGQYMTEPKYPQLHEDESLDLSLSELNNQLTTQPYAYKNPASRLAYTSTAQGLAFFVDGKHIASSPASAELIQLLCNQQHYPSSSLSDMLNSEENKALILSLFNSGVLYFYDDDTD
ncbi:cupin domain-containing protein [Dasania sp. GY-MA-18]|uniref:Cupin domain-containing protein n=1 Tax=Dasania phycosphaerae TaxID=2950436 RepID=A0A9J6RJ20_9GAMM|nr:MULTISPECIES: cupin domain-containing protein [Dasania]MCR8921820.1 cupin domain-containing protein [Dasania sp. GY-MA-18]MCZ0864248.1 cupin domain-containing protein [Dasania phycosphaerae]MCZ0867976.1 cupin domain-containing protein [Dasania phycosphaerae]